MGPASRLRRAWGALVPFVVPLLVAAAAAVAFAATAPSPGYRFRASSAYDGYEREGWSGHVRQFGVFFHSKKEKQPWVEIELPEPRTVSRVTVKNRRDQTKRGVPLVLEVQEPDGSFRVLGRRDKKFGTHIFKFDPVTASKLRLRVDARKATFLHLEDVDVE